MPLDVFFYEAFDEEEDRIKFYLTSDIKAGFSSHTIQENDHLKSPAAIISVRTQSIIPLSWAKNITGILSRSTGYDHLKTYLKKSRVEVACGYLPVYCSRSVAEQAMLLWMALLRKLPQQQSQFSSFNRNGLTGSECENRHLLVVGVGNIGYELVKLGKGLGMSVEGIDIEEKYPTIKYISPEKGIPKADVIVCAMNLTSENVGYFNYRLLKKAKPGIIFVNIARGELSLSADLLRLIIEEHLGGLALDVFEGEVNLATYLRNGKSAETAELKAILELSKHSNVILTPHNAFNTETAIERKAKQSIQQINNILKKGRFLWPIPIV